MLEQIAAAFDRQDYQTAAQLLREWVKRSPHDPWAKLYMGRLQEVSGKHNAAEEIYRQILRNNTNAKLISQARQGLQRLEQAVQPRPTSPIAPTLPTSAPPELGVLILEPVPSDRRTALAHQFARLTQTDAYTALSVLPSRSWRLYRTGAIADLATLGQTLRAAGIPAFWAALSQIQPIEVFEVKYWQTLQPKAVVVCQNAAQQVGTLTFDWSEVKQRVEGLLPLFSQVIDLDFRDRLEWKEHIEDYAHLWDLHLPQRGCILRLQDDRYNFHQGITTHRAHDTLRQRWNDLIHILAQPLPQNPIWSDFTAFAESATDFAAFIERIESHVHLPRASDCYLDPAFHLYSSLAFLKWREQA